MILFPPAKINLGLNVMHKRDDGFHEIETCMVEVPFTDVLEILPAEKFTFVSSGLKVNGSTEDNLCVKACRLLEKDFNLPPVYMHLRKNIPMGAGLGGGSADATYVLKGLNTLFDLKLSEAQLETYAAQLGSDCAFFVKGGAQMATGRGEVLTPITLDLKGKYIQLLNPGIHIGTAEAYGNVTMISDYSIAAVLMDDFSQWQNSLKNAFEPHAFDAHPEIEAIKTDFLNQGAFFAAMTGSGSTVFGLYTDKPEALEGGLVFAL